MTEILKSTAEKKNIEISNSEYESRIFQMYFIKLHINPVNSKQCWYFHYVDYDGYNWKADQVGAELWSP